MSEQQPVGNRPSARYWPSPRTEASPMAFTGWEFIRGALAAVGWFLALFAPVTVLYLVILLLLNAAVSPATAGNVSSALFSIPFLLMFAYIYAAPWMIAGLVVGAPFAYGLGMALRRNSNRAIHITVFAVLGSIVGAAASIVGAGVSFALASVLSSATLVALIGIYSAAAAVAVPLGWLFTASRALRADALGHPGT